MMLINVPINNTYGGIWLILLCTRLLKFYGAGETLFYFYETGMKINNNPMEIWSTFKLTSVMIHSRFAYLLCYHEPESCLCRLSILSWPFLQLPPHPSKKKIPVSGNYACCLLKAQAALHLLTYTPINIVLSKQVQEVFFWIISASLPSRFQECHGRCLYFRLDTWKERAADRGRGKSQMAV